MSCGKHLPGRLGRLQPEAIRWLFPELAQVPSQWLFGSIWATEESARQSNMLNAANHGHAGATYGPLLTDLGWATAIDLRKAAVSAEARAAALKSALNGLRHG